ncbi:hypothetical protein F5B17DRAFT_312643 [Nemania serpens]|nr:hypothetical protein F5B17DRAFT_312643 [Nemania serpens]
MIAVIFVLLFLLHLVASESATLTLAPAYASQRPCAQGCFAYNIYKGPDRLAEGIGCEYKNPQNECVCRPDLQPDADAFLQECVDNSCSQNSLDTNSAISIYDNYCANAGYLRSTPATLTSDSSTSSSSSRFQTQPTPHTTQTTSLTSSNSPSVEDTNSRKGPDETGGAAPTNTGTASGGGSNGGSNGLDTGSIIGIVVGILGFIATAIGTWFTYKSIMNRRAHPPPYQPHVERGWRY